MDTFKDIVNLLDEYGVAKIALVAKDTFKSLSIQSYTEISNPEDLSMARSEE